MKKWESPAIDVLDITSTAYDSLEGTVPDGCFRECSIMYDIDS